MKLGERVRRLRKKQGLSQEQFAKKLNIGRSTLANYEQCKRDPNYETVELIAKELNVSPAYLIGWEKDTEIAILKELREINKKLDELTSSRKTELSDLIQEYNNLIRENSKNDFIL